MSNNPPDVVLELTQNQADFLLENCKANISFGLEAINSFKEAKGNESAIRKLAAGIDNFQDIMKVLRESGAKE